MPPLAPFDPGRVALDFNEPDGHSKLTRSTIFGRNIEKENIFFFGVPLVGGGGGTSKSQDLLSQIPLQISHLFDLVNLMT